MNDNIQLNDSQEYRTNKTKSFILSAIVYSCLLAGLYFLKIAYEPIVETEGMGVDLNYGVDLVGSGDIQTLNKANPSKIKEEMMPDKGADKPEVVKAKPIPVPPVKAAAPKPVKNDIITADEDTKVTATKNDTKIKPKVITPVEKVKTKVETKPVPAAKPTPPAPPAPPARSVETASTMKKNPNGAKGSNGSIGTTAGVGGNSYGDGKKGEDGDQGKPEGTLEGKSLYGTKGKGGPGAGGDGNSKSASSVSISGWKNKGPLNIPKDESSETGRIKFKVVIDETGDVVGISVIESSLSPSITNYYRDQIKKKLKANLIPEGTPTGNSNGIITINITRGA
jgi:periplasmic protein TonB